jgi:hypothetical protein
VGHNVSLKDTHTDKLRGKYDVKRLPRKTALQRLNNIANESMMYYMYQQNRLFKDIDRMAMDED